jgi:hypothetical protein
VEVLVPAEYQKESAPKFCGCNSYQISKRIRPKITMGPVKIEKKFWADFLAGP